MIVLWKKLTNALRALVYNFFLKFFYELDNLLDD